MIRKINIVLYAVFGCALLIGLVFTDPSPAVVGFAVLFVVYGILTISVEKLMQQSSQMIWLYVVLFGLPLAWQFAFVIFCAQQWIVLLPVAVCATIFGLPLVRAMRIYYHSASHKGDRRRDGHIESRRERNA
ncbi:MAG: hypothetical protein WCO77_12675 [bacterium]